MKHKVIGKVPCPSCRANGGDTSGDNLILFSDGSDYCFACGTCQNPSEDNDLENNYENYKIVVDNLFKSVYANAISCGRVILPLDNMEKCTNMNGNQKYVPLRGLHLDTVTKYKTQVTIDSSGKPTHIEFPYGDSASKTRNLSVKGDMKWIGNTAKALPLFGMDLFGPGSAKAITITEGEYDAMSVYQMSGMYPAVSVKSAGEAYKNCAEAYDYLNSFSQIYVCFDADEPGRQASKKVASLFDPNKTYVVELGSGDMKDANDYLVANKDKEFRNIWFNTKRYIPKGIVSSFDSIHDALQKKQNAQVATYPFSTLNEMTYGIRLGELNLFLAQEKIGKMLSLDTRLPTPEGWTTVGDLRVGDFLISKDGTPCKVTYITPEHTRPTYKVTFSDGTHLIAGDNHRWTVRDLSSNVFVTDTITMFNEGVISKGSKAKFMVPAMSALELPEKNLPIDPFLLGVWLADGHSYSAYITLSESKLQRMEGYVVSKIYNYNERVDNYMFEELPHNKLLSANLIENKHIPKEYLRASLKQRQDLFEGLMFDGWMNEYYSSNENLFLQVVELARSLGYIVNCRTKQGKYKNKDGDVVICKKAFSFSFRKSSWKSIRSIVEVEKTPAKCLTVDHSDHLFAAGDGWTLTHNTEAFRAIEHHLIKTTDERIGIIHLEEDDHRTICGLVGYEMNKPVHLPDSGVSNEEIEEKYKSLVKTDDRVFMYSHFGSDDPNTILEVIRYFVTVCKCKFVFLDHITMLVTGFEDEDERKKLDYLSTKLKMLTKDLEFTLFMISHVNDDGKTRGSRNISKVADLIVSLERDKLNADPEVRNTMKLSIVGNRFGGITGPSGKLKFDPSTYVLTEKVFEDFNETLETVAKF